MAVRHSASHIVPLQRDRLFLSIYEACKHRHNPIADATALTDTSLSKLQSVQRRNQGLVDRQELVKTVSSVLKRFDNAAYVYYTAFHPV